MPRDTTTTHESIRAALGEPGAGLASNGLNTFRPWLIAIAMTAGFLALFWLLGPILTPFLVGALMAYLLDPAVDFAARHGVPRWLASITAILLTGLIIALLLIALIPIVQQEVLMLKERMPTLATVLTQKIQPILRDLGWKKISPNDMRLWFTDQVAEYGSAIATSVLASAKASGGAILAFLSSALLIPMVSFYFLQDWPRFMRGLELSLPRRWHPAIMDIVREIDELLSQFFRGQLLVMAILAGYYTAALSIAGFELAVPIGILTGLLVFIPYIGYTIGLILALLAAFLQFSDAWGFISIAIIFGLGQLIESFFLTPRLVGERIGLHPVAVIFSLMAFGQLFGFFGILAALPLAATLLVGIKRLLREYFQSEWYREAPSEPLEPSEQAAKEAPTP